MGWVVVGGMGESKPGQVLQEQAAQGWAGTVGADKNFWEM